MGGGDSRIGGRVGDQSFNAGETTSIDNTPPEKLDETTKSSESSDPPPQTFDPKAGGSLKSELGILGSLREAQVTALLDGKVTAAPTGTGSAGGVFKTFKTRDEAIGFAGANSKDTAVFEDQNHQWVAAHPDSQKWIDGRNEIHDIIDKMNTGALSGADGQAKLNEAYVKTLAAALGVSPSEINVVGPNNPPDPNKINFDPALKGKEGTAGAAKLDGNPKSIVIGPDAVKLDNPFDTLDTVAHEASHVRLANDGNKLLAQWQNLKGKKPDFSKWLESEYKNKHISAEQLVTTASAYNGGRNPSEAISYINGFIATFSKDRGSFQKARSLPEDDRLVASDLSQAASFPPTSSNLTTKEDDALKQDLFKKLEDFYKTLDSTGRQRFDAAMQKAIKDNPGTWLAGFKHSP